MFYVSKLKQVSDKSLLLYNCLGCLYFCVDKTVFSNSDYKCKILGQTDIKKY